MTTTDRIAWEDAMFAGYRGLGYDVDDAWTLVAFDWASLSGEILEEM